MRKLSFLLVAFFAVAALVSLINVSAKDGLTIGATMERFKVTDTSGVAKPFDEL